MPDDNTPPVTPDPNTPPVTPPPADTPPADWRAGLAPELRDDPALKSYKDVAALAKSHVEQGKLVGAGVRVPKADAKPEEWDAFYAKLGRPADPSGYEIARPAGDSLAWNDDMEKGFRQVAHKHGLTPAQVKGLVEWHNDTAGATFKQLQASKMDAERELREEWGGGFDHQLGLARQVVREAGGEELMAFLDTTGLSNHATFIKAFAKVGALLAEAGYISGQTSGVPGPDDARAKIAAIMGDEKHPYHRSNRPGHEDALREVARLHELAYGTASAVAAQ